MIAKIFYCNAPGTIVMSNYYLGINKVPPVGPGLVPEVKPCPHRYPSIKERYQPPCSTLLEKTTTKTRSASQETHACYCDGTGVHSCRLLMIMIRWRTVLRSISSVMLVTPPWRRLERGSTLVCTCAKAHLINNRRHWCGSIATHYGNYSVWPRLLRASYTIEGGAREVLFSW